MSKDERDDRSGQVERELASELERDEAELAQIQATLKRLHELRRRIDEGRLEPDDRALLRDLIQAEYDALESSGAERAVIDTGAGTIQAEYDALESSDSDAPLT